MPTSTERRGFPRYRLSLPVTLGWTDDNRIAQQRGGFTRDVSTGGVFVMCDAPPRPGTSISLELLLPLPSASAPSLRVLGNAEVVREEQQPAGAGFAALGKFDLPAEEADGYPTPQQQRPI